jgi:glycosyltransferase involved in cell wall biosynthesis
MVFFSTIVPVYNRANLIQYTLDSILSQKEPDTEIIVVDDGSTDGTLETLRRYGNKIKVLRQQNKGPGAARNLGISHAKGKYITFLDSDDLWFPWTLSKYKEAILKHNFPAFIMGESILFRSENEVKSVKFSPLTLKYFDDYYSSSKKSLWLLPGGVAVKTEFLHQAEGFTNKWINGEDSDLWLRLGTAKGFVRIQSPPVLAYRQHPNSAVANHHKSYEGALHKIQQEKSSFYPGGRTRRIERLEILMRHIRPVTLACLREKKINNGWKLYQKTFIWNIYLKRFSYLLAFIFLLIQNYISKTVFDRTSA